MIVCIFVNTSEQFEEKVKAWFSERSIQAQYVKSDANVDRLTELLFEFARNDTKLVLIFGGVDVERKAFSSIAVKRIIDGRIYTLETYLCEYIAENCPECMLTSPTVGIRDRTLIVSLPDHEVSLKVLDVIMKALKGGG